MEYCYKFKSRCTLTPYTPFFIYDRSSLLLRRCLGLGCLLFVAVDHDDSDKRADDGGAQESEEDGDADRPDAREEESMERVTGVNKWLTG